MAKGDAYKDLYMYLKGNKKDRVILSFEEIELILNRKLPFSAYTYKEWWSNDITHSQAISWMEAGFKTEMISDTYEEKKIIFNKRL